MNNKTFISILVATKDRPLKLKNCLTSILKNSIRNFELIIIDQSTTNTSHKLIRAINESNIRYYYSKRIGNTHALNIALQKAKGDIYVFTDDDCIVPSNWLRMIIQTYRLHPEASGVSGQTLPFLTHRQSLSMVCPGTYQSKTFRIINNLGPVVHSPKDGFGKGTNMSFKREVFQKLGGFKEWLGPGSIAGAGGNETEFIYRAVKYHFILCFNPKIIVYHDRWITQREDEELRLSKMRAYIAFISYTVVRYIDMNLLPGILKYRLDIIKMLKFVKYALRQNKMFIAIHETYRILRVLLNIIIGMFIGTYLAVRDTINLQIFVSSKN